LPHLRTKGGIGSLSKKIGWIQDHLRERKSGIDVLSIRVSGKGWIGYLPFTKK